MHAPTRLAPLALAVLLLSPALGAGTARAVFLVGSLNLTYDGSATTPTLVSLVNGHENGGDVSIAGKSISDGSVDFTTFSTSATAPNPSVDITSLRLDGKFAFRPFFLPPQGNGSVLFQMSN